jgi:hypothetical protein
LPSNLHEEIPTIILKSSRTKRTIFEMEVKVPVLVEEVKKTKPSKNLE